MTHHRDQTAQHRHLVSVVIPCYNEHRLDTEAIERYVASRHQVRVIIVNDGSSDGTARIAAALKATLPQQVAVVELGRNRGKAEAVRRGILASLTRPSPFVAFWDADLSAPLADLDLLLARANTAPSAIMFAFAQGSHPRRDATTDVAFRSKPTVHQYSPRGERRSHGPTMWSQALANGTVARQSRGRTLPNKVACRFGTRVAYTRLLPFRTQRNLFVEIPATS